VLALCLWGICAADFATPGLFDRAGNVKFQDCLPLYVSAQRIAQGRASELYNEQIEVSEIRNVIGRPTSVRLRNLYGPQVVLLFVPLTGFSFLSAAWIWIVMGLFLYGCCVYLVLRTCPRLLARPRTVALAGIAFPPLFHFFVRGQTSALVLACFTAAYLAFRSDREWLAGIALGLLVFKPQFLVALPLVLLLARSWRSFSTVIISAVAQLAFAWSYFGSGVMRAYFDSLWHVSRWIGDVELGGAPIQMHSLRSFWSLLIPWPEAALSLYVLSSIFVVGVAAVVWKSSSPLAVRFSGLTLAATLVNPHLFVYDLLALVPVFLLVADWILSDAHNTASPALRVILYLAFVLPLLGVLSRWTHLQLSVPVLVVLLWMLWRYGASFSSRGPATPGHRLASRDSRVV
jgi:hypothetical protein